MAEVNLISNEAVSYVFPVKECVGF